MFIPYRSSGGVKKGYLNVRSVQRIIKKYFKNVSYNDLKLVYYKYLCDDLPDIKEISTHSSGDKINLDEIYRI